MKKILIPLAAALLAGCECDNCRCKCDDVKDPVVGNWGLKLGYDDMNAGHAIFSRDANGNAQALVLWRWASPEPMQDVKFDGKKFSFFHPRTSNRIEGTVCGGKLKGAMLKQDGSVETTIEGWRNPPIEDANTDDARLGEPIDLLKDGLDGWEKLGVNPKFGWSFKDGVLSNTLGLNEKGEWAGGGVNLRTKRADFYDFNLEYDVRVPKDSNSGVYLRARYECQVVDSYGQTEDRIHSMGTYYGRVAPSVAAEKPAGEWQHVNVTLYKRHITVVLNGVRIIDNAPVVGITGGAVDANEFVPGFIYLQGDHSDADYKNMILRPCL